MSERAYPPLEAFERLQISDGLTITADRWQQAHRYHRQRQNFQYQSLYEPGIVYGLGVAIVPEQPDGRLVQVEPGVAIDFQGNPIIVPQREEFRIASDPPEGQTLWIYLVVSYVDPDQLRLSASTKTARETFRLTEKLHLDLGDVEICRIHLQPGATQVQPPANVFEPGFNELDFRGRCHPRPHPPLQVQLGQVIGDPATDGSTLAALMDLLRSLEALYPPLRGVPLVRTYPAQTLAREARFDCQLLHLPFALLTALSPSALQRLGTFLAQGGLVLVVADFAEANLLDLLDIGRELQSGLLEAERDRDLWQQLGTQLKMEIANNQEAIAAQLSTLEQQLGTIAPYLGISPTESGELGNDHPLRHQPFTFSQFPQRLGHPVYIKNWGGLVLLVGDLSRCWGCNATPPISREVLRAAQEWGVNLLHFAAQRWQWMQAMHPPQTAGAIPLDTLQQRVQTM